MGSIISKIADDIDDYLDLFSRFNETPIYRHGSADCYGVHADELRRRADAAEAFWREVLKGRQP